ncbi:hypothetical protein QE152_g8537 [Popillia japonica]|uniref:Uncharacterized protein n=1 Tax=Popillia japonica TaxID=7064 RepID=A0AAW1M2R3_POPJA
MWKTYTFIRGDRQLIRLTAAAGPVLANVLNKFVDKVSGKSLTLEIPLKKTLSQKDKDTIEKNIRTLMNITNKEDSDCDDDIPFSSHILYVC